MQGNNPLCMAYRWMFFCMVEYDSGSVCNNLLLFCSFLEIISLTDAVFIFFISFIQHSFDPYIISPSDIEHVKNFLQTVLSVDQFLATIHFSHLKLLKYCHKTQEIKRQCNNKFPIV
jgi:hypothetical protein